jgi:molecular chaperone GrpE (heat shock protein)
MEALVAALGILLGFGMALVAYRFHGFRKQALLDLERARERIADLDVQVFHTMEDRDSTVKRIQDRAAEEKKFGHRDLAFELLEVIDNLDRSLEHTDAEGFAQGVEMIRQQLGAALRRHGVDTVDALGEPFDPRLHEVVETEESIEAQDTVLREWLRGYTINDRVLRAAKVVIAVPPGSKVEEAEEVVEEAPPEEAPAEETPAEEASAEEAPAEEPGEPPPDEAPVEEAPKAPVIVQDSNDAVEHVVTLDRPLAELEEDDLASTEVIADDILEEITEELPQMNVEIEE